MAIFEPNIYMREIKELYSEELALLKQIRSYGREHSQGKMERVEKVKLLLLFRIYSNLYSSLLLTVQVLKTGKISFFQLPIGLLLRCCFTDCLFALYIQRAGKERAYEELDLRTIEYANSMLERNLEELTVIKQSKGQLKDAGFTKQNSIKTKDIVDFLVAIPELKSVAMRLYHYFKYFSQYEHFSENGQGDVLASMEKDGNDNIHLPSAIRALGVGMEEVMKNRLSKMNK